ncbi:unnamed protein product [Cyprideis torosa]|uniref:Uncharacterized protein n=1 Tax=Cyprideis torosa TaxID=163714 RepID=A0A7R8W828_9CRUS|nr:unnamed protein product [Cyprideis torosa]CAG0883884.1 unnamed protein product [Cyprideis torosa]
MVAFWNRPVRYLGFGQRISEISGRLRNEHVRWLDTVKDTLCLGPDSFFLAVSTLDRFLGEVQARPRYLRCIALSCLFLAAKVCEEEEHVPSTRDLINATSADFTAGDVLRMERIILDKLGWSLLDSPTALQFLEALHPLVLDVHPVLLAPYGRTLSAGRHLKLIAGRMRRALYDHRILRYPPSLLAMETLRLEVEISCSQFSQDIMDALWDTLEWKPRGDQFDLSSLLSSILHLELKVDAMVVYSLGGPREEPVTGVAPGGKKRRRQRTESKCTEGRPAAKKFQEDESEIDDAYACIRHLFPVASPPAATVDIQAIARSVPPPGTPCLPPGTPMTCISCFSIPGTPLSCGLQSTASTPRTPASPTLLNRIRTAIFGTEEFPSLPPCWTAGLSSPGGTDGSGQEHNGPQRTYAEVLRTHLNLPRVAALTV